MARRGPYDTALRGRAQGEGYEEMIDGPHFRLAILGPAGELPEGRFAGQVLVLPLADGAALGDHALEVGTCTLADGTAGLTLADGARVALVENGGS